MDITLKINGHTTTTFGIELKMFRGKFIGLNSSADFYTYCLVELKKEGTLSGGVFG
ncbi:TPA: hypothetical protein PXP34_003824 [Yersinia enterocolitica]|nr:hypothetical protein [Yersinia enterocolitica]